MASTDLSPQARLMRERRANPAIRQAERESEKALDAALKRLREAHEDEFITLLQEERRKRNLPAYEPWSKKERVRLERKNKPELLSPIERQKLCKHPELNKLSYGTFCRDCGKKIR